MRTTLLISVVMSREFRAGDRKKGESSPQAVCDYLSGMTDQYSGVEIPARFTYRSHGKAIDNKAVGKTKDFR